MSENATNAGGIEWVGTVTPSGTFVPAAGMAVGAENAEISRTLDPLGAQATYGAAGVGVDQAPLAQWGGMTRGEGESEANYKARLAALRGQIYMGSLSSGGIHMPMLTTAEAAAVLAFTNATTVLPDSAVIAGFMVALDGKRISATMEYTMAQALQRRVEQWRAAVRETPGPVPNQSKSPAGWAAEQQAAMRRAKDAMEVRAQAQQMNPRS